MKIFDFFCIFILIYFFPNFVLATKPCEANPCFGNDGKFQESKCRAAADWIMIGTISDVKRNIKGYPFNKDFAHFLFHPEIVEKGIRDVTSEIEYTVGWCDNPTEVPVDYSGKFRFYGMNTSGKYRYIHFEAIR